MAHDVTLTVLMLDVDTLHVRLPNGHYLGVPRHRIAAETLADLENLLGEQTEPLREAAPKFKRSLLLNALVEDVEDQLTPHVLEIRGIVPPDHAAGHAN